MPSTSRSLSTVSAKKSKEVDYVTLDSDDEDIIAPSGKKIKDWKNNKNYKLKMK